MGRLRIFLGAFGQPGHAFPMLALGAELAARGHEVAYETWSRWREPVEAEGMRFVPAPEHASAEAHPPWSGAYERVADSARQTQRAMAGFAPDVVVHDILTLAPALAGELEGAPVATLIPHVFPVGQSGLPPYGFGARMPRTATGRTLWRAFDRPVRSGLVRGRSEYNAARRRLGLAPAEHVHSGLSRRLTLVGTLPQLEYPRPWPVWAHVVGPLMWEPPCAPIHPPPGDEPLVLVAPSTAQDPDHRLLRAALEGLAGEPVRVLATWNRRPLPGPARIAPNTRLVEWLSYSQTMPGCALVICHAGHGTLARALASGCPVVAIPHVGDMAENAARVDWAGAGVRVPWPLLSPLTLRRAVRRALARPHVARRAAELANWAAAHPAAPRAADLVERLARDQPLPAAAMPAGPGTEFAGGGAMADRSGAMADGSGARPQPPAERPDAPAPTR
ncbi:MAG TPA: nucleotide disphospho-sugar-binding domain-containing protein [Solirubrobacteraceae bacterium]|nr:nucleotide disphospho-sugar-binding domain-containing protein [Solirubrobacteraceae bacterium]